MSAEPATPESVFPDPESYQEKLPDMTLWQGRVDEETVPEWALRWHQKINRYSNQSALPGVTLAGFASDEGVRRNKGRPGAASGPDILRKALAGQPWNREQPVYDSETIICRNGNLEAAQLAFARHISKLLDNQQLPVGLGGGHEIAWASYQGLIQHLNPEQKPNVGIINFDAHFDLRKPDQAGASSGTPFYQIADYTRQQHLPFHYLCLGVSRNSNTRMLFERARELGVDYQYDEDMTIIQLHKLTALLSRFIDKVEHVYLTIDLDAFPAALAPGVSAPASRGVPLEVVEPLLEYIRDSEKLRLIDIAEFNPSYDIDHRTSRLAARLIHLLTLQETNLQETNLQETNLQETNLQETISYDQ